MTHHYILTSAPIKYEFGPYSRYESFDQVSQGLATAPLVDDAADFVTKHTFPFTKDTIHTIIVPSRGQTTATAALLIETDTLSSVHLEINDCFDGVRFAMRQLIEETIFSSLPYHEAIHQAREAFVRQLMRNNLTESKKSVLTRLAHCSDILRQRTTSTLVISHAFFMKLLEIHLTDPQAFTNEDQLVDAFQPHTKPYGQLDGFIVMNDGTTLTCTQLHTTPNAHS